LGRLTSLPPAFSANPDDMNGADLTPDYACLEPQ
jgi:hypothetical protein